MKTRVYIKEIEDHFENELSNFRKKFIKKCERPFEWKGDCNFAVGDVSIENLRFKIVDNIFYPNEFDISLKNCVLISKTLLYEAVSYNEEKLGIYVTQCYAIEVLEGRLKKSFIIRLVYKFRSMSFVYGVKRKVVIPCLLESKSFLISACKGKYNFLNITFDDLSQVYEDNLSIMYNDKNFKLGSCAFTSLSSMFDEVLGGYKC